MLQTFTEDYMLANCGCYDEDHLLKCSFMLTHKTITLQSILESEIPLKDKFWFVCKKLATKAQNQQLAISVAEIVLPIYERRYPDNKAPREAIETAKQYLAGHISLSQLLQKRLDAAYADAADAADAAYAAYAAAADAAYAAYAAADAAADASYSEQLLMLLMTTCLEK